MVIPQVKLVLVLSETVLVLVLDASRSRRAGSTWLTPRHPIRARIALAAFTVAWFIFAGHSRAQSVQEPVARAWALSSTDCALNAAQFRCEPVAGLKDDQPLCSVMVDCGEGTEVIVAVPVDPVWLIPELDFELDLQPERAGAQLLVRAVLPDSIDPATGEPLAVWLAGPQAETAGRWNRLRFSENRVDLQTLLRRQVWVLRGRLGGEISARSAYIDAVGVNVHCGPGKHRVLVGQPVLAGAIAAQPEQVATLPRIQLIRDLPVAPAAFLQPQDPDPSDGTRRPALAVRSGTVLEAAGQPLFPRIIQHNGEPMALLAEAGFNTLQLPTAATEQQLAEATAAGLWIVCPPPPSLGIVPIDGRHDRVMAWSLGLDRTAADLPLGQSLTDQIRQFDLRTGRPLMAGTAEAFAAWGGLCDVLLVGTSPLVTGLGRDRYGDWVAAARESTGDRIPVWADLPTEAPAALIRQAMAAAGQVPPLPLSPAEMEELAFEAVAGGARGLRFLSRSRLDGNDPQSRLRLQTLRRINRRLDVAEPWAAGGIILGTSQAAGGVSVAGLRNNRGQLLIVNQSSGAAHPVSGAAPVRTLRFTNPWSGISDQAWQVTDEGLVPLPAQYGATGVEIQLDQAAALSLVVVTQDPTLVDRINQTWRRTGTREQVELRNELTSQWLALLQVVESQSTAAGRVDSAASGALNDAVNLVRNAQETINNGTPSLAGSALDQADQRLALAQQEMSRTARSQFAFHTSSPLLEHAALIPMHWQLATRLAGQTWEPNGLAGGDFENLQQMVDAGWENVRPDDPQLQTDVGLTESGRVAGGYGLQLTARHPAAQAGLPESPPLRIVSAPVFVRANRLVRIHGWFRVPDPLSHAVHGLLVHDSLGGRDLGVCTTGSSDWQEFTLYRGAGEETQLRVIIELNGYGTALLDEITVQAIELPDLGVRSAAK